MPKQINKNLTEEQKEIMFNEATERPGTSELNFQKAKAVIIVLIVIINYLILIQNMKVEVAGLHFFKVYQMYLKQKLTIYLDIQELNIIVKIVEYIMVTSLMMVLTLQEKDIATMVFV